MSRQAPTQVFKVQLLSPSPLGTMSEYTVLIYNHNRSIMIQDDAKRYTEDFLKRLRRKGKAFVIMRVYPDKLQFLGYTKDRDW